MTELQLICSPFRTVELIISTCCSKPLPDSISARLKSLNNLTEQGFLEVLKSLSQRFNNGSDGIDYRMIVPALSVSLNNETYIQQVCDLLPTEVVDCLQGKLPEFPQRVPPIDWERLINEFIQFYPSALKYAQIGNENLGFVENYISCAFTNAILDLIEKNEVYNEGYIDEQLEWVLEQIAKDRDLFLNDFDDDLIEKGDLIRVAELKHRYQSIVRQLKDYPKSYRVPKWVRQYSTEEFIDVAERKIESLEEIKQTILEKQTYDIGTKAPDKVAPANDEITQNSLALFYFYAQAKGYIPEFETGKMEQSYKEVVAPYSLSWKAFQQAYNLLSKQDQRLKPGNRGALLKAIKMLKELPKALQYAKDDLNTIETRYPLT